METAEAKAKIMALMSDAITLRKMDGIIEKRLDLVLDSLIAESKPEKSIKECKDEVAKKYGYKNFKAVLKNYRSSEPYVNETIRLFAKSSRPAIGEGEWISTEDETQTPKHRQRILMFCKRQNNYPYIVIGHYEKGDYENYLSASFDEDAIPTITHWMPLPKFPKIKNKIKR